MGKIGRGIKFVCWRTRFSLLKPAYGTRRLGAKDKAKFIHHCTKLDLLRKENQTRTFVTKKHTTPSETSRYICLSDK